MGCLEVKLQRSSEILAPGWLCNPGYENRNNISSEGVREHFQRCVRHTPRNRGLETQPWAKILRTPPAFEFLCKAAHQSFSVYLHKTDMGEKRACLILESVDHLLLTTSGAVKTNRTVQHASAASAHPLQNHKNEVPSRSVA
jgi:hypothetical protein